jgi:hypothetical protein
LFYYSLLCNPVHVALAILHALQQRLVLVLEFIAFFEIIFKPVAIILVDIRGRGGLNLRIVG